MNLKITNAQIESYAKTQQMPTLQFLADNLCEDEEIEYVKRKEKEIASHNYNAFYKYRGKIAQRGD